MANSSCCNFTCICLYLQYLHVHVFSPPHSSLQEFAHLEAPIKVEPQSPGGSSLPDPAPTGGTQQEGAPGDQPPATKEEQSGEEVPPKEDPGEGDPPPHLDVSTPTFDFRYQSGAQYSAPPSGYSLFPVRSWDNLTNPFYSMLQAPADVPAADPPVPPPGEQEPGPQERRWTNRGPSPLPRFRNGR